MHVVRPNSCPKTKFSCAPCELVKKYGLDTFTMKTGACLNMAVSKLGVIVGVNYIISYQCTPTAFALVPKNLHAGYL